MDCLMTQTFERYEDAYSQLFQAQRALSYSVCKSRSCKNRPKNDPNRSDVSRVDVRCQFGGKPQSRPNKGKYNSSSKKLDCPFEVRIARGQYEPHYSFKVLSLEHNHPPIENHLKCSAFRQASRAEFGRERLAKIVEEKISVGNPSASQVVKQINEEYPQLLLYPADIHHILRDFRTANYGPNTSTHAFVKLLEEDKTKIAHYAIDREQTQQPESATTKPRLTKVIWVFNSQVHLWKNNPEILMIDKTYKANRFNMPLLQIMGMTSLHTTFNVAYVLISDEDPQSFRWVSNQLKKTLRLFNIPEPGIVLTDHDANFKCALDDTFPYVQQQICAWHIVKDVVLQVKRKWSGSSQGRGAAAQGDDDDSDDEDNGERADQDADAGALATAALAQTADLSDASFPITAEGLKDAWLHVMSSPTEEKYMHRWHQLKTAFAQEPQIIDYIDKTYNPFRHQFATFSISKFRNYGIVASVRVESTEETLKQSLKNRFISLDKLLLRTWEAATAQRAMYDTQFDKEMTKYLGRMARDPLLEGIQRKIGSLPLTKLFEQLELVREEEDLGICSQTFSAQWGLPCRHRLDELVDDETPLALSDIDSHWWLRANTEAQKALLYQPRELDPEVIAPKERAKNNPLAVASQQTPSGRRPVRSEPTRQEETRTAVPASRRRRPTTQEGRIDGDMLAMVLRQQEQQQEQMSAMNASLQKVVDLLQTTQEVMLQSQQQLVQQQQQQQQWAQSTATVTLPQFNASGQMATSQQQQRQQLQEQQQQQQQHQQQRQQRQRQQTQQWGFGAR